MKKFTKRDFLRVCGGTAAAAVLSAELPTWVAKFRGQVIKTEIAGRKVTLEEVMPSSSEIHAQYQYLAYQYQAPSAYYGQYAMWQQQQAAAQYIAYMQQLAAQRAWIAAYQQQLQSAMQQFYQQQYQMSQPFPVDPVESVYSNGTDGRNQVLTGFGQQGQTVTLRNRSVKLCSAVASFSKQDFEDDWESITAPQSNIAQSTQQPDGSNSRLQGIVYKTSRGGAFASDGKFRDADTGNVGNIVMANTELGREQRLIPLDNA